MIPTLLFFLSLSHTQPSAFFVIISQYIALVIQWRSGGSVLVLVSVGCLLVQCRGWPGNIYQSSKQWYFIEIPGFFLPSHAYESVVCASERALRI
ncbi:hypothetical protein B0I37DRAFT_3740 [Chaetomium sp. MPI-CAGE-AT-0009]|nr:hypothetical protein B0I37DRAFT_3740 [Chaetomium sp. MPI-CAGE-AT-0009]